MVFFVIQFICNENGWVYAVFFAVKNEEAGSKKPIVPDYMKSTGKQEIDTMIAGYLWMLGKNW